MDERLARRPEAIRDMFSGVSRRYDLLNRLLSLRQDVRWRARLVAALALAPPGRVLDLATGTGDVALAVRNREVVGGDFCIDMLALARDKARRARRGIGWTAADALALPLGDASVAAVTIAFGIRNFVDLDAALKEIGRVLVPRGVLAILEFQRPSNRAMAWLAAIWNRGVVTPVGKTLSSEPEAYSYLPASVDTFPDGRGLAARIEAAGFAVATSRELSGGIVVLTVARRREER